MYFELFVLCLFLVLFVRRFRVGQTLAGAIFGFSKRWLAPFFGFSKRWLAPFSGLAKAGWRHFRV